MQLNRIYGLNILFFIKKAVYAINFLCEFVKFYRVEFYEKFNFYAQSRACVYTGAAALLVCAAALLCEQAQLYRVNERGFTCVRGGFKQI